jgi:osmotically-inducible protein OsmY
MHTQILRMTLFVLLGAAAVTGCGTMTGRTTGQVIDDTAITSQVKARLAGAEAETLTRIDVDTTNGVVYLNGVVEDATMKTRAEQIARSQEGVTRVVNNLQVARPR